MDLTSIIFWVIVVIIGGCTAFGFLHDSFVNGPSNSSSSTPKSSNNKEEKKEDSKGSGGGPEW